MMLSPLLGQLALGLVVSQPQPAPPDPGVVAAPPPAEPGDSAASSPQPPDESPPGDPPTPAPSAPREPAAAPPPPAGPALLRPTDRNHFFTLLVGGSRFLRGGSPETSNVDFKIDAAFGAHGKRRKTVGGALVAQLRSSYPFNGFTIGPRLQWDVPIVPTHAIFFHANITAGYRVLFTRKGDAIDDPGFERTVRHAGVGALGFGVSTIVGERLLLIFRPANLELEGSPFGLTINWDVLGGLGVVW